MQDCSNSIANALQLPACYINLWNYSVFFLFSHDQEEDESILEELEKLRMETLG